MRETIRKEHRIEEQRSFRVAIVGTGGIARAHAAALRDLGERVVIVAAVDVDGGRVAAFASEWNIPRVAVRLSDILSTERVDVVHICTPPGSHAELAAECLRAGVTPVLEKPPTLSLTEMDDLIAIESESTVSGVCIFQHRFGSGAVRLRRLADSGALGRPMIASANTYWYRPDSYFDVPWRGNWEVEGGGPTMGHGIHQFDLLLAVLGPWAEITAIADRLARPTETEDVSFALVRFESGAVATVVNSVLSPRETSTLRFDFERATVEVEHLYGYRDADWRFTPIDGAEDLSAQWPGDLPDRASGHPAQFEAIYDALARGDRPEVTLAHARDTEEFIAAVYASAFERRPIARGELTGENPYARRMGGDHPSDTVGTRGEGPSR